ncbi:MAG: cyclic nucleotide-binding domain-containing protein [Desulfuromonadaceae bacterium]|nr:cyclic nucleotide-binding domain-containing protein [Desulfuromonadaceae bacterium]
MQNHFTFFGNLPEPEVKNLLRFCDRRQYCAGDILWQEGDRDNQAAFILDGKIGIRKMTEFSNKHVIVGTYARGSVVGELCLLTDNAREVSALAISDVDLLYLSNSNFEQLITSYPALGLKLLRALFQLTSRRLSKSYERIASIF